MDDVAQALLERRVLILAPTGRDAALAHTVLGEAGIRCATCRDLRHLVIESQAGAGAVLISEEALGTDAQMHAFGDLLAEQPPWSDLPILLLSHPGADSPAVRQALRLFGNVTIIERPVRVSAILAAVQAALRARRRQYHAREHLVELDRVARALRESEARLKGMFDTAAVGIAEVTPDGRFALVNDTLCRLLGKPREALVSLPVVEVAQAGERDELGGLLARLFAGEISSFNTEKRFERPGGGTIWAELTVSIARIGDPRRGAHGVAVIEDITERKRAEEGLREADRRKDEFLATLAHELRNPLAPIRNSLNIFRLAGVQDPVLEGVTAMMERQVAHMVRMVDDLLEVSRISRGKIELRKERVDLAAVLRNAVDTSLPLIKGARHKLTVEIPPEPIVLDADPVRLSQVFANLLNNAAKYTPEGGQIVLTVSVKDAMVSICVKDDGEGIPAEMLPRIFDMFTQVNTGTRAQGGLGIGLTLARTLAQMHGGTIEAFSQGQGQGCEFLVKLPLAGRAAASAAEEVPATGATRRMPRRRVLVVDDNRDSADSMGMLLEILGAEVRIAHDGAAALEEVRKFAPAVVLLDIGMPGMCGYEVARRLREDPAAKAITIVALTGWGQNEDRRRSREAGFDYHLVKPADLGTLQSILSMKEAEGPNATLH